jgi:hypothetical protein
MFSHATMAASVRLIERKTSHFKMPNSYIFSIARFLFEMESKQ